MPKLERRIEISGAWDKRDSNPKKNYGIHGMELRMYVSGEKATIQFIVYTNWFLKQNSEEIQARCDGKFCMLKPMPADVGYHAKQAQYEGQEPTTNDCKFTGGDCYYDGSSLHANELFEKVFVPFGSDAMFDKMEEIYHERFGD